LEKSDKPLKSTVLEVGRNGSALLAFKFVTVDDFSGKNVGWLESFIWFNVFCG
jgi:hypothetical protein